VGGEEAPSLVPRQTAMPCSPWRRGSIPAVPCRRALKIHRTPPRWAWPSSRRAGAPSANLVRHRPSDRYDEDSRRRHLVCGKLEHVANNSRLGKQGGGDLDGGAGRPCCLWRGRVGPQGGRYFIYRPYRPPLGLSRTLDRVCAAEIGAERERGPLRFPHAYRRASPSTKRST